MAVDEESLLKQLTRMQQESNRQLEVYREVKAENRRLRFQLAAVLDAVAREVGNEDEEG